MRALSDNPRHWTATALAGWLELTQQALPLAVRTLFGEQYVGSFSDDELLEAASGESPRGRRWNIAKYLLRRQFRSGRVPTRLRDQQLPLEPRFWHIPYGANPAVGSWGSYMAFEYDPRGRPDVPMYFIEKAALMKWLNQRPRSAKTRPPPVKYNDLRTWYVGWIEEKRTAGTPTSGEDDWTAAQKKFRARVRRGQLIPKLREELAPAEWQKQGRRPAKIIPPKNAAEKCR